MSKFKFKKIEIENFRSIQEKITLEINPGLFSIEGLNLDESGMLNGAGKSSIISALYWCLTGNALTNEVLADEVVNITIGKNCSVKVYIESDSQEIQILRTRKHSECGNNLLLYIGEQDLTCHKIADTQERINKLLKIPFDLLKSTIFLTHDIQSAFSELPAQQRITALESIRDYSIWDKVRDEANKDIKVYNKEINTLTSEIDQLTGSYKTYEALVKSKQTDLTKIQEEIKAINYNEELHKFDELIAKYIPVLNENNAKLKDIQSIQLESLSEERKKLNDLNEEYNVKKSELNDKYNKKRDEINNTCQTEINRMKNDIDDIKSKISSAEYEIRDLNRQKSELEKWFNNPNCPMCGKPLTRTEEEINSKRNTLSDIENRVISLNTNKASNDLALNSRLETIEDLKKDLLEKLKLLEGEKLLENDSLKQQYDNKTKEVNDFIAEKELKQRQSKTKIQELMNEVNKTEQEIEKIKHQKSIFEQKHELQMQNLEKINSELLGYHQEIDKIVIKGKELRKTITEFENKRQLSDYFYKLLGSKGELRPYLLNNDINFLNTAMQKYISRFFKNTEVTLKLNGASIDIIINTLGIKKNVSSLSGGEKKRLNLAIQFALYDLIRSTSQVDFNIICLDEIESELDTIGIQQLIEIIEDISERIETVFWITNHPMVKENTVNKIICKKKCGKTEVEVQ